jgi:hypothetical protein
MCGDCIHKVSLSDSMRLRLDLDSDKRSRSHRQRLQLRRREHCALRLRRRQWRLMRSVRNEIAIVFAIALGIGQACASEFDSIFRLPNI